LGRGIAANADLRGNSTNGTVFLRGIPVKKVLIGGG